MPRKKKESTEKLPSRMKDFQTVSKSPSGKVEPVIRQTDIEQRFSENNFSENTDIKNIESIISSQIKDEKESKEIFNVKDIKARTDINDNEISVISRLLFLCDDLELTNLRQAVNNFMILRLSKSRKSRKEFIESLKMSNQQPNMFPMNNLNGANSGQFR